MELVRFNGTTKSQMVLLDWQTASEQNAAYFEIERSSLYSQIFEKVGFVKSKGSNSVYEFIDDHPLSNITYYRLK